MITPYQRTLLDYWNKHGVAPTSRDLAVVIDATHDTLKSALAQANCLRALLASSTDSDIKAAVDHLCATLDTTHGRT